MKKAINVWNCNNSPNFSRFELVQWVNDTLLSTNISKVEEMSKGYHYCQMFDQIFPGVINMNKVKFSTELARDHIGNFKLLQKAFISADITKELKIEDLIIGRFKNNFALLVWFRKFYDINKGKNLNYNTVEKCDSCLEFSENLNEKNLVSKSISTQSFTVVMYKKTGKEENTLSYSLILDENQNKMETNNNSASNSISSHNFTVLVGKKLNEEVNTLPSALTLDENYSKMENNNSISSQIFTVVVKLLLDNNQNKMETNNNLASKSISSHTFTVLVTKKSRKELNILSYFIECEEPSSVMESMEDSTV
ncbi:microtubule-associated protein RP/EB family member 2-like isoform X1 [Teleopsis dalmanni]|uniref:microtubule-associated protein RP/EB family member 2-like isoform X1 n=1 Tax=Teleopsis dalmanni TaxID=139649 RepID=UPI0018CE6C1A|nr:microtubule-associated protein RP/EB family member 2-like isoform X1 [Teleopsis dalmanni]XP_037937443.1 microtubule-associated protein RP/EB family member 2-like isoform X1 [Teleopsis dalmanni]